MGFYLGVAAVLWIAAFLDLRRARFVCGPILFLLLWVVAGLRFETGFDWAAYSRAFNEIPDLLGLLSGARVEMTLPMEPLFVLLVAAVKTLGGSLQLLFALASAFNLVVLYRFLRRASVFPLLVLAVYFCWVFLPLQMAVVRQSLAVSFILLALTALRDRRPWLYALWVVIGAGFQYSAIVYLPLYPMLVRRWPRWGVVALLGALSVMLVLGRSPMLLVFDLLAAVTPGDIATKIELYRMIAPYEWTLGAVAFMVFNVSVFGFGVALVMHRAPETPFWNALINLSIFFCVVMLATSEVPILWNRIQYVAIVAQGTILAWLVLRLRWSRPLVWGAACFLSVASLHSQLSNRLVELAFIPYQSWVVHAVTGAEGDGGERTRALYDEVESLFQER